MKLSWFRIDERIYVDAMALEVLLRDYADQLRDEEDDDGAEAVDRLVQAVSLLGGPERELHV
jgi:hypothetical protein